MFFSPPFASVVTYYIYANGQSLDGCDNDRSFQKGRIFFCGLFFLGAVYAPAVFGGDRPFNNAANWGWTGLMEIPNARVLEDGVMRMGYAEAIPYRWYAGGIGIFPGLEFSGRFTELTNVSADLYGNYKDKAFDPDHWSPAARSFPLILPSVWGAGASKGRLNSL